MYHTVKKIIVRSEYGKGESMKEVSDIRGLGEALGNNKEDEALHCQLGRR